MFDRRTGQITASLLMCFALFGGLVRLWNVATSPKPLALRSGLIGVYLVIMILAFAAGRPRFSWPPKWSSILLAVPGLAMVFVVDLPAYLSLRASFAEHQIYARREAGVLDETQDVKDASFVGLADDPIGRFTRLQHLGDDIADALRARPEACREAIARIDDDERGFRRSAILGVEFIEADARARCAYLMGDEISARRWFLEYGRRWSGPAAALRQNDGAIDYQSLNMAAGAAREVGDCAAAADFAEAYYVQHAQYLQRKHLPPVSKLVRPCTTVPAITR